MTKTITFRVSAADFDRTRATAMFEAHRAWESARNDLIREFMASQRFKAACDLAGYVNSVHKSQPTVTVVGAYLCVSLCVDEAAERSTPSLPPLHIDPKLANVLLQGKLLTDDEKRAMVARLAPGVVKEAAK